MPRPSFDLNGYEDVGAVLVHPVHKSTYSSPPTTKCTDVRGCGVKEYRKTSATWGLYQEFNCNIYLIGVVSLKVMNLAKDLVLPNGAGTIPALKSAELNGFVDFMQTNLATTWDIVCPL